MWIFSHFQAAREYLDHRALFPCYDQLWSYICSKPLQALLMGGADTAAYHPRSRKLALEHSIGLIVSVGEEIEEPIISCIDDSIKSNVDSVIRGEIGGISFLESFELMNRISDQVCKTLAFDCRSRLKVGDLVRNLKYEYLGSSAEYLVVEVDDHVLSKYPNELYFVQVVGPGTTPEEQLHPADRALPILNLDVQFCGRMSIEKMLTHPHPLGRALALKLMDSNDSYPVSRPKSQLIFDKADVPF